MSHDILWRNDAGYEHARRGAVSNGRKPDRFPDVIVRAHSNGDVVAAVHLASEQEWNIALVLALCAAGLFVGAVLLRQSIRSAAVRRELSDSDVY